LARAIVSVDTLRAGAIMGGCSVCISAVEAHQGRCLGAVGICDARSAWSQPTKSSVTDAEQIALRERCSVRQVNMTISLAFLAPKLVRAAVEGRLPRGINIERLRDTPAEWKRQFEVLGLNPQQ
jgi:hypothetical protein